MSERRKKKREIKVAACDMRSQSRRVEYYSNESPDRNLNILQGIRECFRNGRCAGGRARFGGRRGRRVLSRLRVLRMVEDTARSLFALAIAFCV